MVINLEETKEEQNIKIYPIYKMLSWDLLFYYSINFRQCEYNISKMKKALIKSRDLTNAFSNMSHPGIEPGTT